MKRFMAPCLVIVATLFFMAGAAAAAEVSQGKCVQYDKIGKTITIEEYDIQFSKETPYGRPTGTLSVYDVTNAQIGVQPEPGDILRLAYNQDGENKAALKVMNVSKQDLKKK
jgi:hypothetical protein